MNRVGSLGPILAANPSGASNHRRLHDAGHMAPPIPLREESVGATDGRISPACRRLDFAPPNARRPKLLVHRRAGLESVVTDALHGDRLDGGDIHVDLLV